MWLSRFVELLKPSRSAGAGSRPPRRTGRSRPLAVEPLEDRLLMTGQVEVDIAPGTKTRPKPGPVMTFVLEVAVNWLGPVWLGGGTTPGKPNPDGSGGPNTHNELNVDLSSVGVSALSPPVAPTLATDLSGPLALTTIAASAADAAAVTPAKIDTFFQYSRTVGSP